MHEELFPRDFIYCLDAPNNYFGPDKVFLDEETSGGILREIDDCESYLPFKHKKEDEPAQLPPSLYRALNQFVLARTIRNLRGQSGKHCSMMINVSRFVAVQKVVRNLIARYLEHLRVAVKANYAMPEEVSNQNDYMQKLKNAFSVEYGNCGFSWIEIKGALFDAVETLRLFVINSKSDEALDYKKYEKEGKSLTAITVGGLSLSRGLTIEGLCISYMYRNTRMYDTLMQMGRWFGYRSGYEDVCRVYLHQDAIDWYAHVSEAAEELREQIFRMRRDGLSPKQFGLYVRAHPDRLLITDPSKMRSGEKVTVSQNYSGRLVESYILPRDHETNKANEELISRSWRTGFGGGTVVPTSKGWTIQNVPIEVIEEFLMKFQTHSAFSGRKSAAVSYLQAIAKLFPLGDILMISLKQNGEDASRFRLGTQIRQAGDSNWKNAWRATKDRIASRGDEKLGLTPAQKQQALRIASEKNPPVPLSDYHYREVRKKPLLMVHVINPMGRAGEPDRVPAFGISFPPGLYQTEIEVVANTIWMSSMYGNGQNAPEAEVEDDD